MKSNCIISLLTKEQKDIARPILEKESCTKAAEILAEPPPKGIGLSMSRATANRLKERLELEKHLDDMGDTAPEAAGIAAEKPVGDFPAATLVLLKEKAFKLVLSNDPFAIDLSCRILRHLCRLEPAGSAAAPLLTLELCLRIAEKVLFHANDLASVHTDGALDHKGRVQIVAEMLFGAFARGGKALEL